MSFKIDKISLIFVIMIISIGISFIMGYIFKIHIYKVIFALSVIIAFIFSISISILIQIIKYYSKYRS